MAALQTRAPLGQQDALGETLVLVAGRVQNQRKLRGGVRGLIVALAVDILLAGLFRAALLPDASFLTLLLFLLPLAGINLGGYLASRSPITPMDAARLAEASLPLKERLSSALEFSHAPASPLLGLQHADAEAHARALNTRQIVPRRLPREAWLVPLLLLALALMLCLPNLPFGPTSAQRAEQDAVRLAGRQLAQAAHQAAQQADAQHQPEAKRQAQKMEALGKRMVQGHMDRAQALAAVSKQEQPLAQAGQTASNAPSDPGQAAKDLARASHSPAPSSPQASALPSPSASASPQGAGASAKQTPPQNAQHTSSGPGVSPTAPRAGTSAPSSGSSPPQQTKQAKAASGQQPSAPAASSIPEAQQALENARRQLAGSSQANSPDPAKPNPASQQPSSSAPAKAASPPKPGTSGKPGASGKPSASSIGKPNSPSAAQPGKPNRAASSNGSKPSRQNQGSAGKPGGQGSRNNGKPNGQGQSGADKPNGQGQGNGSKPGRTSTGSGRTNSTSAQPSKGHGQPGQGSPGRQNGGSPGGSPGTPAPGGGAGQAAKAPFHSVLPPTAASKSQGIYLGTPRAGDGQGRMLPKQSALPSAPAGPSRVPYGTALPRYRKGAEAALDQEQVPPSQRAVVRRYFNSLQPAR